MFFTAEVGQILTPGLEISCRPAPQRIPGYRGYRQQLHGDAEPVKNNRRNPDSREYRRGDKIMKRIIFTLSLAAVAACSSVPDKKILKDKDYQLWQKDLAARASRESHDLSLVAQLTEIATHQRRFRYSPRLEPEPAAKIFWRYEPFEASGNRDSALPVETRRSDCKSSTRMSQRTPKIAASAQLIKRRPVIEKSKSLPAPLKNSPYTTNPYKEFSYAQMMQASEVSYLDGSEKGDFCARRDQLRRLARCLVKKSQDLTADHR